jgi:hypothetical protein
VSEIIREMHNDGTLHALAYRYFADDYTGEAKRFNDSILKQDP